MTTGFLVWPDCEPIDSIAFPKLPDNPDLAPPPVRIDEHHKLASLGAHHKHHGKHGHGHKPADHDETNDEAQSTTTAISHAPSAE